MSESERKAFPEVLGELETALEEISKSHELDLREHAVLCAARIYISQLHRCLREGVYSDVSSAVAACEGRGKELTEREWLIIEHVIKRRRSVLLRLNGKQDLFVQELDAILAKLGHKP